MNKLKIKYNSPVILTFAIISFIVLIADYITLGISNKLLFCTYQSSLLNPLTYVRLFTHVLGHSGWQHYINNMLLFLLIGPLLEEKYGNKKILSMILVTAAITGIINNVFFNTGLLGASGIVFMFIILSSFTQLKEKEIPITFIIIVILYLGKEIMNGILSPDNISQMAHLIGGLCGSGFGFLINKNKGV